MLSIIERFVVNNEWSYGRLDGSTPVGKRQVSECIAFDVRPVVPDICWHVLVERAQITHANISVVTQPARPE